MKKYYDNLDDYDDHSPSPVMEITKYIMSRLFAVAGIGMLLAVCAYLETL